MRKNILLSLLIISLFTCCNGQKKEICIDNLEKKLAPLENKSNVKGEIINIRDSISCIEWDSLLVVMAIGTKKSIEENTKISIPYSYNDTYTLYGDNDAIIFFIQNKKALCHIIVKGDSKKGKTFRVYDFLDLIWNKNHIFIPKEKAVFEVYSKEVKNNRGQQFVRDNAVRLKSVN